MITDHIFSPRVVYQDNKKVILKDQCGHYLDPMINAPAFDPIYCNRPPHEHTLEWVN